MAWYAAALPIIIRLFLVIDPLGNVPLFLAALSRYSHQRAKQVTLREMNAALVVMLFFSIGGLSLLSCLEIDPKSMGVAGGSVLLIIAIEMILPKTHDSAEIQVKEEPFIFPLAVPLIAGPSVMATLVEMSQMYSSPLLISSLLIAWVFSTMTLVASQKLKHYLGAQGTVALERMMGLILAALSIQMIFEGIRAFYQIPRC